MRLQWVCFFVFIQDQLLGLDLLPHKCHPVLIDEKVEREGKRVLDWKQFSSNLAYLEEWQRSWRFWRMRVDMWVGWRESRDWQRGVKQPSSGDDQLATKRNRMKAQLDDLEHEWETKASSKETEIMTIKIVTKLTMLITMPDASSSLPERHHSSCTTDAKAEGLGLRHPLRQGLAASRVKPPSITPGCLPICQVYSLIQPAS